MVASKTQLISFLVQARALTLFYLTQTAHDCVDEGERWLAPGIWQAFAIRPSRAATHAAFR
jgi:hypothetical protein